MNTEEINHIIKTINEALKEEDIDFTAVIILDRDIENLIIGKG
jgi:predicted transcriptional regulator